MTPNDLIFCLRKDGFTVKADGQFLDIAPAEKVTADLLSELKRHKQDILQELHAENRQAKVLALLDENPSIKRAVLTDTDSDPDNVILTIAVRHIATCEMLLPKADYEPWQLLTLTQTMKASVQHDH